MPLYDCKCEQGHRFERAIALRDFAEPIICSCGARASRLISAPLFSVDKTGYNCPVTGEWIGSKRQHEENLKRQGCRVLEEGETRQAAESRRAANESLDERISETAASIVDQMSSEKKEKLYNEITKAGVDLAYERGARA